MKKKRRNTLELVVYVSSSRFLYFLVIFVIKNSSLFGLIIIFILTAVSSVIYVYLLLSRGIFIKWELHFRNLWNLYLRRCDAIFLILGICVYTKQIKFYRWIKKQKKQHEKNYYFAGFHVNLTWRRVKLLYIIFHFRTNFWNLSPSR